MGDPLYEGGSFCLLCKNEFDRKPAVIGDSTTSQTLQTFREAFQLFCKLLSKFNGKGAVVSGAGNEDRLKEIYCWRDENCLEERRRENGLEDEIPCCSECHLVLLDLLRHQQVIEETRRRQEEVFTDFRLTVIENVKPDHTVEANCKSEESSWLEEEYEDHSEGNFDNDSPYSGDDDMMEVEDSDCSQSLDGRDSIIPRTASIKPCSVSLTRLRLESFPNLKIEAEWEPLQSELLDSSSAHIKNKRNDGTNVMRELFYIITHSPAINEDILLILDTPINVSSERVACLELDCLFQIQLEGTMDYYAAFESIKTHVIDCHYKVKGVTHRCPVCHETFYDNSKNFRLHIFSHHTPYPNAKFYNRAVTCESCRKPEPYHNYYVHTWDHKNEQERDAALKIGSRVPTRIKRKIQAQKSKSVDKKNVFKEEIKKAAGVTVQKPQSTTAGSTRNRQLKQSSRRLKAVKRLKYRESQKTMLITKTKPALVKPTKAASKPSPIESDPDYVDSEEEKPKKRSRTNTQKGIQQSRQIFYCINEEILLFIATPVKFEVSRKLKCLEDQCNYSVKGTDYSSFENMKEHVISNHMMDPDYPSKDRTCPICPERFDKSIGFKAHLFITHSELKSNDREKFSYRHVMCTSCTKPEIYFKYDRHCWEHKSEMEKIEALKTGDGVPSRLPKVVSSAKIKPKPTAALASALPRREKKGDELRPIFYCINEDILLLFCTLIQYKWSRGLKCLEKRCNYSVKGVNYCDFERMRDHVTSCHGHKRNSDYISKARTCFICKEFCHNGTFFKRHVFETHSELRSNAHDKFSYRHVMCTSCTKPELYFKYDNHCWKHKSEQEKADAFATGDGVPAKVRAKAEHKLNSQPITDEDIKVKPNEVAMARKDLCYKVNENDDLLLFRCSMIEVSSTKFKCLHEQCSFTAQNADYWTFEEMKLHIARMHRWVVRYRTCVICGGVFLSDSTLRDHVLQEHVTSVSHPVTEERIFIVVCESCAAPIPSEDYDLHMWQHKNKEEQEAVVLSIGKKLNPKIKDYLETQAAEESESESCNMTSPSPPKDIKTRLREEGYLFYLLNEDTMFHNGVLINFTPTEFTCLEQGCGTRVRGNDYFAFTDFREHAKASHLYFLKSKENEPEVYSTRTVCPVCLNEFSETETFACHVLDEHKPPAVCISCWKPVLPQEMRNHVRLHMNREEMGRTKQKRKARGKIIRPFKKHREPELPSYTCTVCSKQFSLRHYLVRHEETHKARNLRTHFNCPECGYQMLSKMALKSHIERQHRPDLQTRKRECRICSKQFHYRDGEAFRIHMRSHSGETPWVCEKCGKGFVSKYRLKKHFQSVHNEDIRFQCEFCAGNYKTQSTLRKHQRKAHRGLIAKPGTNNRPPKPTTTTTKPEFFGPKIAYPCEYCDRAFPLKSRLTKRLKISHAAMLNNDGE